MSRRSVPTTLVCCVCGTRDAAFWRRAGDHLLGGPRCFQAVRCRRCGTVRLDPRPSPDEMAAHYVPTTYARADDSDSGVGERLDETNRRTAMRFAGWAGDTVDRRVLDIGCGDGRFMRQMELLGWRAEGLEVDPVAAGLARDRTGAVVHEGPIDSAGLPAQSFGLVSLVHVLEHVPDPRATLESVRDLLVDGGWVGIALPNVASAEASLFRSCWYPLDLPRHYWGFTPHSLTRLAEDCGFDVVHRAYFPLVNSIQSLRYAMRALGGKPIGEERDPAVVAGERSGSLRSRVFREVHRISEELGHVFPGEVMEVALRKRPGVDS
jgi:SAM-dependent methyltransferase